MAKISACLVIYNEEKTIRRCLESVKDVVDEIIVVHDGECGDKTLKICSEFTNKIFIRGHIGEGEPHRPFSFQQASGDWILQIDADEFLSEGLKKEMRGLASREEVDAYEFLWPLWDGVKYITKRWPHKRCFFRKDRVSFLGIVHFVAEINGKIQKNDLFLEHRPDYNNYTYKSFRDKWLKWARLQVKQYFINFDDVEKFNYKRDDWPTKIKIRVRFPLILMPLEFLTTFFKSLTSGGWTGDWLIKFKVAFMLGVYRIMINYYIFIYKK